jgi:hypothetical protein
MVSHTTQRPTPASAPQTNLSPRAIKSTHNRRRQHHQQPHPTPPPPHDPHHYAPARTNKHPIDPPSPLLRLRVLVVDVVILVLGGINAAIPAGGPPLGVRAAGRRKDGVEVTWERAEAPVAESLGFWWGRVGALLEVEESWHGFGGVTGMKEEEEDRRGKGEEDSLSLSLSSQTEWESDGMGWGRRR